MMGAGLEISGIQSSGLGWFLIGIAAMWVALLVFSGKSFLKMFPSAKAWMPFIESDDHLSLPHELTNTYIRGHSFKIADLAHHNRIVERTFEDCHIYGPAVLAPVRSPTLYNCTFEGSPEQICIAIAADNAQVIGPIAIDGCIFRRCSFRGIGFIAPQETANKIKAAMIEKMTDVSEAQNQSGN